MRRSTSSCVLVRACAGIAAGVGGVKLDRPARQHVVALLEEDREALLHLDAARGERAGLDGEEPDADGPRLRRRRRHFEHLRRYAGGERSLDDGTAVDSHGILPLDGFILDQTA